MNDLVDQVQTPFLTNDQILENIRLYRSTHKSVYATVIVNNFIKLLIKKARKYKRSGINVGDLIHEGIEGLMEAIIKSYNLTKKEKFITYITIIVERRMKDSLDVQKAAVMFPKNVMTQQRKIRHAYHKSQTMPKTGIFYSKMNIDDFIGFKDILAIEQINDIDLSIEEKLDKESLQFDVFRILEGMLTTIEKDVIIHSFGLRGESTKPLDAISLLLKISSQKVRKIKTIALNKIKNNPKSMTVLEKYFI